MQSFRVDLKTFLGLAMSNQYCHAVRSKYLVDFLVGFLGKKIKTLLIPIYIYICNTFTPQIKGIPEDT